MKKKDLKCLCGYESIAEIIDCIVRPIAGTKYKYKIIKGDERFLEIHGDRCMFYICPKCGTARISNEKIN